MGIAIAARAITAVLSAGTAAIGIAIRVIPAIGMVPIPQAAVSGFNFPNKPGNVIAHTAPLAAGCFAAIGIPGHILNGQHTAIGCNFGVIKAGGAATNFR